MADKAGPVERQGNSSLRELFVISVSKWIGYFGNNLFQIAATIGAAVRRGESYGFPRWEFEIDLYVGGCFHEAIPPGEEYSELGFHYDPIPDRPNLRLSGFFQSEKYFSNCQGLIRSVFMPRKYRTSMPERSISLQVRRGNYLSLPDRHPLVSMDYYSRAIQVMKSMGGRDVYVFSDDLPWCRENFKGMDVIVDGDLRPWTQYRMDHMIKSMGCQYHIMANSSFSWWCAWLCPNPDKVVIAPRQWFGPAYAHYDTKDLLPSEWIVL